MALRSPETAGNNTNLSERQASLKLRLWDLRPPEDLGTSDRPLDFSQARR